MCALVIVVVASCGVAESLGQSEANPNTPQDGVVLTKLFQPVYPRIALLAMISGDVVLKLGVRQDGTVASTEVIRGHPLLIQAALDSAQHSQFECRKCTEPVTPYRMVYTFQLGPARFCEAPDSRYPQVTQSQNHVTLVDQPVGTCDPVEEIRKVRSAKCLYLWKCGHRSVPLGAPDDSH
ncbi:MAG: energy transducer TonB [Candidatus Acidiferrales bacterium]